MLQRRNISGGYYNRHKLHSLRDVGRMLWSHPWSTCTSTTIVLVPYTYPAYERRQRKAVHTSNSFAFVVFINKIPFIKRYGYGIERLGWSNAVRAEIRRKSP